jgi:hypothetical protein
VLGVDIQASTNLRFRESGHWALSGSVGLEKHLYSGQARAHPCLSSERELHIHSNSQRCRPLPSLAAIRRRRRRHSRPRTQFHIRITVQKKKKKKKKVVDSIVEGGCEFAGVHGVHSRSLAMRVVNGWVTWSLASPPSTLENDSQRNGPSIMFRYGQVVNKWVSLCVGLYAPHTVY